MCAEFFKGDFDIPSEVKPSKDLLFGCLKISGEKGLGAQFTSRITNNNPFYRNRIKPKKGDVGSKTI